MSWSESLNLASFDINQEIFEQKLFDLNVPLIETDSNMTTTDNTIPPLSHAEETSNIANDSNKLTSDTNLATSTNNTSALKRRRPLPYRYSIQCKELVLTSGTDIKADPFENIVPYVPGVSSRKDSRYSTTTKIEKNKDKHEYQRKKLLHVNGSASAVDGESIGLTHADEGSVTLSTVERPNKRKNATGAYGGRNRQVGGDYDSRIHGMIVETPYIQPSAANIIDIGAYHADVSAMRIPDITSSLGRLNQWATKQVSSFLHPLPTREKQAINTSTFTAADYMRDLEFRPAESVNTISLTTLPLKYRCRGRIGRGGRLVVDRIPVSFYFAI